MAAKLCEEMSIVILDESDEMNVQVSDEFVEKPKSSLTTTAFTQTITETDHHPSFMCACSDLPEALQRIHEGVNMLRTRGEIWFKSTLREDQIGSYSSSSSLLNCMTQIKEISKSVLNVVSFNEEQIESFASREGISKNLVLAMRQQQKLLVPLFAYGGILSPADVALVMQMPNVSGVM